MEKSPDRTAKPSTGLVPAMDNLPAPVRMQEGQLADIRDEFGRELAEDTKFDRVRCALTQTGSLALLTGTAAAFATTAVAASSIWVPLGAAATVLSLMGYIFSGISYTSQFDVMRVRLGLSMMRTLSAAERQYKKAQKQGFDEKLKQAVVLADRHLAQGGLLDETVLAYLVTIKPEYFREASDQLAITVLQARRMLFHACAGEGQQVSPPLTFLSLMREHRMAVNPLSSESRRTLRGFLADSDKGLPEDDYSRDFPRADVLAEVKFVKPGKLDVLSSSAGALRSFFILPFLSQDKKRVDDLRMMTLPAADSIEVRLPALRPVEGFAKAVAQYEERNGRLDLPAVYGWENGSMKGRIVGARLALPGPERTIFP